MLRALRRHGRIPAALAGGVLITFLLLLALPLPAVRRDTPREPEQVSAPPLFWDASLPWVRPDPPMPLAEPEPPPETKQEPPQQPDPAPAPPAPIQEQAPLALAAQPPLLSAEAAPAADPAPRSAFEMDEVDSMPSIRHSPAPEYPRSARRRRIQGTVLLRFLVERDGSVAQIQVLEADPPGVFEESALKAVQQWRFSPGVRHGETVRTWVRLPVRFRMEP
ncbi:MAG: energy transducer TonB [Desulfovibrio sp.]